MPSMMYTIMRLLTNRSPFGTPETVHSIVLKNNKPIWKNKPPEPPPLADEWAKHRYYNEWPVIENNAFRRLVKKGWLEEKDGVWTASELGRRETYSIGPFSRGLRRFGRPRPTLTKYRRGKASNDYWRAYWEDRAKDKEPVAEPPRKEHKRGKIRHDGYRRSTQKKWMNDYD